MPLATYIAHIWPRSTRFLLDLYFPYWAAAVAACRSRARQALLFTTALDLTNSGSRPAPPGPPMVRLYPGARAPPCTVPCAFAPRGPLPLCHGALPTKAGPTMPSEPGSGLECAYNLLHGPFLALFGAQRTKKGFLARSVKRVLSGGLFGQLHVFELGSGKSTPYALGRSWWCSGAAGPNG